MNKIICDICGTTYPDTARQCPICGYSNAVSPEEYFEEGMPEAEPVYAAPKRVKGGRFSASNVRKRNQYDRDPYYDEEEEEDYYEPERPEPESNAILVALLVTVIVALLFVTALIFFRYYLPNNLPEETVPPTETVQTQPTEESTIPTVPCTSLALMSGGSVELIQPGYKHLINVKALPEDTTDKIVYSSSDESVATVNSEGRVTAVGEGEAAITVTCGEKTITCQIICDFTPEETTPSETTPSEGTEPSEETQPPTEETQPLKNVTLYVHKTDMTLFYAGEAVQLIFNRELTAEEITWTSDDPSIAKVENGLITAVGGGTTRIRVRYGEQVVVVIVRCAF